MADNITECEKCHGAGFIREKDGSVHTCWDCLASGRLDNHSKIVKDSGINV